ncbi:group I truncated hemoglobin [Novosphingobium sp.]|uniref:group I truncated hemoglobin n=1 Tax=Novosphingobium sp. TaxID=1874826 RepID=UPI003D0AA5AA
MAVVCTSRFCAVAALALALFAAEPLFAEPLPATTAAQPQGDVDWFKEFGVEKPKRDPVTGELPVAPYTQADANAGAAPFAGAGMARAFGGQDAIRQLADRFVAIAIADPRIKGVFATSDLVRLRRTLDEQFCYILNAGCHYSGRDMEQAHKQLGIMTGEMNALVEDLQGAMRERHIPFAAQNRFLAKLAPMKKDVVRR